MDQVDQLFQKLYGQVKGKRRLQGGLKGFYGELKVNLKKRLLGRTRRMQ